MPLYITEQEVAELITMEDALKAIDNVFLLAGTGRASVGVRQRPRIERSMIQLMGGAAEGVGLGLKAYTVTPSGVRFVVLLFDEESGELLASIEADHLGRMRTGAASGVATRYMAPENAKRLGVIGSGWQSVPQIEAVCSVREIEEVRIFSPNRDHREAAADAAAKRVDAVVRATATVEDAVENAEVVVTITTSREPVLSVTHLRPDCHINAVGSNRIGAAELDESVFSAAKAVAADSIDQAKLEAGDLARAVSAGAMSWDRVVELGSIVAASRTSEGWRRPEKGLTVFESLGVGTEDVALARTVYERAKSSGTGRKFPE
jgi:alanine dehydrogenase